MLPIYIKVENFNSYINETINFDEFGNQFLLMGENGSGKSSIIDMITTAIFFRARGTDSKGVGMEELINSDYEYFKIEYSFEMNDNIYIIIREKVKNGSQSLKLFINGKDCTGKLTETQKMINDIIKMDYETFMDTVCISQGHSGNFMTKKPTERKKIISQILQLDKYDELEKYTKLVKKDLKNNLDNLSIETERLYTSISSKEDNEYKLNMLSKAIKVYKVEIEKKDKELEFELIEKTKYEELKKQQNLILARKNNIESGINATKIDIEKGNSIKDSILETISKKQNILDNIAELEKNISDATNQMANLNEQKTTLQTENKILINNITELKNKFKQLKEYNSAICNFCGQEISDEHKENHLNEMRSEGTLKQNEYNTNNTEIQNIQNALNDVQQKLNAYNKKIKELQNEKTAVDQAEVRLDNIISKLKDLDKKMKELIEEKKEIDNINIDLIGNRDFKDNILKSELNEMRRELNSKELEIGLLKDKIERISKDEKEYDIVKKKYDKCNNEIMMYEQLLKAWSKNGIQAIIIDNILPQMEDEINKYLSILTRERISINFITQKESKSGNVSETLDVIVNDSNKLRPYENFSGGEKMRIDFACHIGMSKFLAKRSGSNMDFFVVDEGIGTLDDDGKNSFIDMLNILTTIFKKIAIISHISDIKESFNNKVLVTKDILAGSKVSLVK